MVWPDQIVERLQEKLAQRAWSPVPNQAVDDDPSVIEFLAWKKRDCAINAIDIGQMRRHRDLPTLCLFIHW